MSQPHAMPARPASIDAVPADGSTPRDERALLEALRRKDPSAVEGFVRAESPKLLAVARRMLRSESDARDAVQDAFLSAFRSLDRFEANSAISTWLHRIVVNAALMKLRARRLRPEESIEPLLPGFDETGHQTEAAPKWISPEGVVERREVREFVRGCIDQLPESYRTVLLLRDIEDLDTEETAQELGITANAVKVRLHRARQALRTLLEPRMREQRLR